jgi:hypothetical protein
VVRIKRVRSVNLLVANTDFVYNFTLSIRAPIESNEFLRFCVLRKPIGSLKIKLLRMKKLSSLFHDEKLQDTVIVTVILSAIIALTVVLL